MLLSILQVVKHLLFLGYWLLSSPKKIGLQMGFLLNKTLYELEIIKDETSTTKTNKVIG